MVHIELVTVALLWGLVPLVMQWSSQDLHAGTFTLLRYGLGALFLILPLLLLRKKFIVSSRQAFSIMLLSCATLSPFSYFFLLGVKQTHISIAGIIQGTSPALTVLFSFLIFKRKPSRKEFFGIAITYIGLVFFLLFAEQEASNQSLWLGAFYLVVAIVFFALYTTLSKPIVGDLDPAITTLYTCIGVTLSMLPLAGFEYHSMQPQKITFEGMAGAIYMSLFASVVCLFLYGRCINALGATRASLVTNLVPIIVILSGNLILHEPLNWIQIIALCTTLLGVYVTLQHTPKSSLSQAKVQQDSSM